MKKWKLLTPILTISTLTPLIALASCGNNSTKKEWEVEIVDPTSSITFTKTMTSDGDIEINLTCSIQTKKIKSITEIKIGTTILQSTEFTFANNKITIKKDILNKYTGKIIVTPELADKEVTGITLDVETKEIDPNESFNIKATLSYENNGATITWTTNVSNVVILDKTTTSDGEIVKVTGNMGGTVILTATCNDESATCTIDVTTRSITLTPIEQAFEDVLIPLQTYESQTITNEVGRTNKVTWPLQTAATTVQRFEIELQTAEETSIKKVIEIPKGGTAFEVELTVEEWANVLDESVNNLEPDYILKKATLDYTQSDFAEYFTIDETKTVTKEIEEGDRTQIDVPTITNKDLTGSIYFTIKSDLSKTHYCSSGQITKQEGTEFTYSFSTLTSEIWNDFNYDDVFEAHFEPA